jgi:hypothetical protein
MGVRKPKPKIGKTTKRKVKAKDIKEAKELILATSQLENEVEGEIVKKGTDAFGRPTVMSEKVKDKLIEAFKFGCTNVEAALYAGISEATLTRFFAKPQNQDFKDMCTSLKETPALEARVTLVKALKKSAYYALKYLERKKSDEFSIRVRQIFEEPEPLTEEEQDAINEAINENL